ncbi:two-component response regulator [Rhodopirellula maiorica SM1]|uniref:Two-component response regulator n=1 Tax=Rhodopirellula maiorica SM1 TaxID=1265738 RepID=M5RQA5_9BACT|nr:response regulator [Rhodopirellula maiorica]EMI21475.1 two-component response regulator [Rhodopirellula maiorica SM1]
MSDFKRRILITEDNRVLGDVLRFNLERSGFDVTVALDGAEAMDLIDGQSFDLLITDYQMPNVDGAELCHYIRQNRSLDGMFIIMCSAKGMELDREQLREQWDIAKLVLKPFSVREIVAVVNDLLTASEDTHAVCT